MAVPQPFGVADQEPPPPPPHLRQVEGQNQQPERDHPEAENGQKAENAAGNQQKAEPRARVAIAGQGNALSS